MSTTNVQRKRRGSKCECGCGQTNTGRLRKLECIACGYIAYTARGRIAQGLPSCPCGGSLEPPCLIDRAEAPGDVGREAWAEYSGRQAFSAVQSERGRKGAQIAKISRAVRDGQAKRAAMLAPQPVPDLPF